MTKGAAGLPTGTMYIKGTVKWVWPNRVAVASATPSLLGNET